MEDEAEYLMNTVVIERLGIGSLTNRAALPPYLPQFRGNRSPRYFIDMPAIDIHRFAIIIGGRPCNVGAILYGRLAIGRAQL